MNEQADQRYARVLDIVAAVLRIPEVEAEKSFFDLGGTSLQALRICARLERDLYIAARPQALFDSESLAEFLAAACT
ncbi:acyl carrier protein [Actinoplanes sp. Pm04-4]|uniref:Acyl carrier protein n=1 Tax=Paractinoplanes pyxinae TaxID=2997416 RepID=A0ABT4BC46_9ACTN|nr:acyl carrier protein [Actinoplanes pyxinae]MCY1144095.1 acyl carrier protein [Actinoplanes pyxinae]